jgi:hypothetical protein
MVMTLSYDRQPGRSRTDAGLDASYASPPEGSTFKGSAFQQNDLHHPCPRFPIFLFSLPFPPCLADISYHARGFPTTREFFFSILALTLRACEVTL